MGVFVADLDAWRRQGIDEEIDVWLKLNSVYVGAVGYEQRHAWPSIPLIVFPGRTFMAAGLQGVAHNLHS